MRLLTILTPVLLLATWLGSGTAQASELENEFEVLISRATNDARAPIALQAVTAAERLSSYMEFESYRARMLDASLKAKNPLAAFKLTQVAARAAVDAQSDVYGPRAEQLMATQGCLTDWSIVGPFGNENMEGLMAPMGPETGEEGPFPGKVVDVIWRDLPRFDQQCEYWLNQVIEPDQASVIYLSTFVEVDKAQKATLLLGTHGAYRVWVNGVLVGQNKEDFGMSADNEGWKVDLKKGANTVLLKVGSTGSGTLGAVIRLVDANLKPLKFEIAGAETSPRFVPPAVTAASKMVPDPRALRTATAKLAESPVAPDALHSAWLWKDISNRDVSTPWRNVAVRILADASKLTPRQEALAAELYDEEFRQLAIVEAAFKRAPEDPFIISRLAALYEGGIPETRQLEARRMLEKLVEAQPDFLPARLSLSSWFRGRGFSEKAFNVLKAAPDKSSPAFINRMLGLIGEMGTGKEREEWIQKSAKTSFLNGSDVWAQVRDFSTRGEHEAALVLIRRWRLASPASMGGAREEVQQLRALGRNDDALAVLSQMISINPGDADTWRERAELLVALGRLDEARSDVEAALERRPQDQFLRDYSAFLKPQENRFWDAWFFDDVREFASNIAPTPFNYDSIIDQSVVYVAANGLSQQVHQRVDRVQAPDGIDDAKFQQIAFQAGDERVDVLRVRIYKADGTVSEDYDQWESGGSRKASTTYNDTAYVNVRANNVGVGDLVEVQWRLSQVANANFRGDYFGDIQYLQGGRPLAFARYAVLYPNSWELFFRVPRLEHTRTENVVPGEGKLPEGFRSTSFELKDIPNVQTDPDQPGATDVYDYLLVSNKETWDDIGAWWWNLIKEQLIVDDEMRAEVRRLIKGKKTVDEKVRAIHNYVVRNTRYLHVGLGIHGWKPYRTTSAFRNRFGDCKDKAALLKVLLDEAGVDAEMVLVRTRSLGKVDEFPASMHVFNHAITYVPSLNIFLDGTAEYNGTRELTPMDQGAQALVVSNGGNAKLVQLPVDKATQNVMLFRLDVDLRGEVPVAEGNLSATGVNAVYFRSILEDPERRDEAFEKFLGSTYPGAKLLKAKYSDLSQLEKDVKIEFSFESPQLRRSDGSRDFLLPSGTTKDLVGSYAKLAKRSQDLDIRVPFTSENVVTYRLAKASGFSKIPENVSLQSRFGALDIKYVQKGDEVEASVIYRIDVQRVSVEDYNEFRSFVATMNDALNETITLGNTP